ncbi:MAG: hypothetical protein KBS64_06640 [Treponema sp.]|nr:hypothetical protein [Candidatus Treponema equi]
MKKTVLKAILAFSACTLFAYDFSGIISDSTKFNFYEGKFEDPLLKQSETFTGDFTSSNFAMELSVQHKTDIQFGDDSSTENDVILDCTLFKFFKTVKLDRTRNVQLSAGRFFYSDLSGAVVAQPNDGVFVKYSSPKLEASVYGGYTGLQNVKNVTVVTSKGGSWAPEKEKDLYDFTAPYAIGALSLSAPYCLRNQTVSFECLGAFNVGGPADLEDDDSRLYGTLCLTGPLSNYVFYTLSGTVEATDFSDIGFLGKLSFNWFIPYKNSVITLGGLYAPGTSSSLNCFTSVTKGTVCLSKDEPGYNGISNSGISKIGLSGSMIPVDRLVLSLGGDVVFIMPDNSAELYGIQVSAVAMYKMYSDFNISLSVNNFTGKYKNASRTEIGLGLALAL